MLPEKQQQGILQMILGKNSKREITKEFGNLSVEKVLGSNYPSIGQLRRKLGDEKTEKLTAVLILDTATFFDGNMDSETAMDIAAEVAVNHNYFSLEDLYIVLQELKQQEIFGKLTANKILVACKKYAEKRMQAAAEINYNRHLQIKESRDTESRREQDADFMSFYHEYEKQKMEQAAKSDKPKTSKSK